MNFEGAHEVPLDQETLWESLHDPEVLEKSIPGCERLTRLEGEGEAYEATVLTKVGPIKAKFDGRMEVERTDPPNAFKLHGSGKAGAAGAAKGEVQIHLKPLAEAATELRYDASVAVTGRMAQIGSKMLKGTAEAFATEFFKNLAENVAPRTGEIPEAPDTGPQAFEVPGTALPGGGRTTAIIAGVVVVVIVVALLAML